MQGHAPLSKLLQRLGSADSSGLPRYQRLANALIDAVKQGILHAGDRLPAEEDLAQLTPYSLGTVQRALRLLSEQGLIVRRHGLGNFVADERHRIHEPGLCRFLDNDGTTVLPLYSTVVARERVTSEGPWTRYLGVDRRGIMRIDRLVSVNEEFNLFSRFYAHEKLLKPLWKAPLEKLHGANFTQLIATECKLPITDITHTVRMDKVSPEVGEVLDISASASALCVQAIARAGHDICVYYQEFFIPPTRHPLQFPERTSLATAS